MTPSKYMKNKVAIIGKTNTGKSTLFNRLVGFRKAIVLSEAGITRDRNYADVNWRDREFTLIDTGGIDYTDKQDLVQKNVFEQVKKAIMEADLIIHLVDVMTGIQQEDTDIARFIRKNKKKSILVINKNDIKDKNYFLGDFYHLGLGEPCLISAEQGININGLLDRIIELLPYNNKKGASENDIDYLIRVAIIGKPNVGKSSILNALLNEERAIVDQQPGTTRDAIDASINFQEYRLEFVDTAGLRRRKSVKNKIEYFYRKNYVSIKRVEFNYPNSAKDLTETE
jgi:GTP-binding protein